MTAKIVSIFNQKGGCGKTMTTMQVGGALALMGKKVLVVDMDRQGTSVTWSSHADPEYPFPASVISLAPQREMMVKELGKFADSYDLILIDCPPAIESSIPWASLLVADLGIMPIIPVADNVWAAREARDLAIRAREQNPVLQTYYLLSRVVRTRLYKAFAEQLAEDKEIPTMSSFLSMRNVYPESQMYGATVHSLPKSEPAVEEVDGVAREILQLLEIE